jgi:hypothetical protein
MTMGTLLNNYSMAQMALISHVAYLKFKDEEDRGKKDSSSQSGLPPVSGRILNKDDKGNAQAYALIAGGILG